MPIPPAASYISVPLQLHSPLFIFSKISQYLPVLDPSQDFQKCYCLQMVCGRVRAGARPQERRAGGQQQGAQVQAAAGRGVQEARGAPHLRGRQLPRLQQDVPPAHRARQTFHARGDLHQGSDSFQPFQPSFRHFQ